MSPIAIKAENLAKQYSIGAREAPYRTFRDAITSAAMSPLRRFRQLSGWTSESSTFWALQGVSFEVPEGEVLGIVGRNGAGKSTLLKLIGRITEPTRGRLTLRGRVASLLEVGTGFHPELTGRENIFLNGAILGMTRAEIRRKFDEIVAFAGVETFLDTPVKRYSSGMYVRLAFAVAANLEPEILLVDEVLAVGDAQFQKKCLDRMKTLSTSHTTVVFVSHSMAAVQALCTRCLLLEAGQSVAIGPTTEIVARYVQSHAPAQQFRRKQPAGNKPCVMEAEISTNQSGSLLYTRLRIRSPEWTRLAVQLRIKDSLGSAVAFAGLGQFNSEALSEIAAGETTLDLTVPLDVLAHGEYSLDVALVIPMVSLIDLAEDCLRFSVNRPPRPGAVSALQQSWGYGCVELPVQLTNRIAGTSDIATEPERTPAL